MYLVFINVYLKRMYFFPMCAVIYVFIRSVLLVVESIGFIDFLFFFLFMLEMEVKISFSCNSVTQPGSFKVLSGLHSPEA